MPKRPQVPEQLTRVPNGVFAAGRGVFQRSRKIAGKTLTGGFGMVEGLLDRRGPGSTPTAQGEDAPPPTEAAAVAEPGAGSPDASQDLGQETGQDAGPEAAAPPANGPDASVAMARPAPAPRIDPELARDLDGEWDAEQESQDAVDDLPAPGGSVGDGEEPLLDPSEAKAVRTDSERAGRAADPDKG